MNAEKTSQFVNSVWNESIISTLEQYIKIPNQSPMFDSQVLTNGYMQQAVDLLVSWVEAQKVPNLQLEIVQEEGRTPVMLLSVPATKGREHDPSVFLYGHLDKQPPLTEDWSEGLGPYTPVIRDGKLYGRGGADDGYSVFAAVTAIKALQEQGIEHPRLVTLIEASEESGSTDLVFYLETLKAKFGDVGLIVCLDSGAGDYERLWLTTSLRGVVAAELRVDVLHNGMHSGAASGVVPSSFRVIRQLLTRLEDPVTGKVLMPEFFADIPELRKKQASEVADVLGDQVWNTMPFVDGMRPNGDNNSERLLAKTWLPTVSYTGIDGIPRVADAGNVLRPFTAMKLSIRTPPTVDAKAACEALRQKLTTDVPYGAKASFSAGCASGWNAPLEEQWLLDSVEAASKAFYGKSPGYMGEGGSIPFMGLLGTMFPKAQFCVTGVLGPASNAHGPDEFLHLEFAKKVTASVAHIIAGFAAKEK